MRGASLPGGLLPVGEKENSLPFRDVFSGGGLFAGEVFDGEVKNWLHGGIISRWIEGVFYGGETVC